MVSSGCARRPVIETRRPISRWLRWLLRARPSGSDPFADRRCQLACAFRVAAGNTQQRFEELWRSRVRIDPPRLVLEVAPLRGCRRSVSSCREPSNGQR